MVGSFLFMIVGGIFVTLGAFASAFWFVGEILAAILFGLGMMFLICGWLLGFVTLDDKIKALDRSTGGN